MTARRWPLGGQNRPESRAALSKANRETLRDWLYFSVLSWSQSLDDGERVKSFLPLSLGPQEPARQIGSWCAGLSTDARLEVEAALADTMEAWDPGRDIGATILLVKLAGHIGGRRAAGVVNSVLGKALRGSEVDIRDLAEAVAFFARKQATGEEARNLCYRLRDVGLAIPSAVIVLLVRAAADFGVKIIGDLRILAPDLIEERLEDKDLDFHAVASLRRFMANVLVNDLGASSAFKLALNAQRERAPAIREALLLHRLEERIDRHAQATLRDKLTGARTIVDVSEVPRLVQMASPSMAINDNLIARTGIDRLFEDARK